MDVYFWIFATMAVLAGLFTIGSKEPLPSALGLLTVFVALAALYLHLHAPLVAIFQITIYAGAILVLVVFVIMLLTTPEDELNKVQRNTIYRTIGALLGTFFVGIISFGIARLFDVVKESGLPEDFGHPSQFGDLFFQDYLLHFEVASVLLLVALVGAIYLAKKNL